VLWTNSTTEARVSLREDTPIPHIDLAELAEQARASSRTELINLIERRQEKLVEELCGSRYSRGRPYRRGGTYAKRLVTYLGEITFKVKRIINRRNGEATEVLQGRPDEAGGVRIHHELRRRAQGVRDRDGDPRPQADHPQLRPGISPPAAGGQQDGRRSRRSRRRLHQGPGPGQQGDEQRARPHLRRRAPARPGGQRGVAQGQGRRPRLRRRAWTGERRRRREAAAVHPPRHKAPTIHPVEGEDEPRREA